MRFAALFAIIALPAYAADRIASIDFFGYEGLDIAAVRSALTVGPGDRFTRDSQKKIRASVKQILNLDPTDVAAICCDPNNDTYIFVGLPGKTWREFKLNSNPGGKVRLSKELMDLMDRIDDARDDAIKRGAAGEDDSQGFALGQDPAFRALQMRLREYALAHEEEIYNALANSADDYTRDRAAIAAGYTRQSARQIEALMLATHDPDAGVRDESTRALGVLLRSGSVFTKQIPAAPFIEMMWSGTWMDRNKASAVLLQMTESRDPRLLEEIRTGALAPLKEMSTWQDTGHGSFATSILERLR